MKEYTYEMLLWWCSSNDAAAVEEILEENSDLDVLHSDGVYFRLAIKHSNVEMLNILIKYYTDNIKEEEKSLEYNYKIYKLKQVFVEAEKRFLGDIAEDIEEMLDQYTA